MKSTYRENDPDLKQMVVQAVASITERPPDQVEKELQIELREKETNEKRQREKEVHDNKLAGEITDNPNWFGMAVLVVGLISLGVAGVFLFTRRFGRKV